MLTPYLSVSVVVLVQLPAVSHQECTGILWFFPVILEYNLTRNKTLGRALDLRANGAWLSTITELNMKCLS